MWMVPWLSNGVRNRGNDASRREKGGRRGRTEKKREVMRGRRIVPRINGDCEERKRDDRALEQPPLF